VKKGLGLLDTGPLVSFLASGLRHIPRRRHVRSSAVIKAGQLRAAFRARPPRRIMLQPEVDAFFSAFNSTRATCHQPDTSTSLRPLSRPPTPNSGPPRIRWIRCDAQRLGRDLFADRP
jgi:hypothetical protein